MSREWKPGEVALVHRLGTWIVGIRCDDGCPNNNWWYTTHGTAIFEGDKIRPLAVIDAEDREQVERLAAEVANALYDWPEPRAIGPDSLQAALREFADPKPSKPDEPQGLGAVVEYRVGSATFNAVRNESRGPDNVDWVDANGVWRSWSELDVTRVLHEGMPS